MIMKIHCLNFSPIEVNTYVIDDEQDACALIDCGCYNTDEFARLLHFLEGKNLQPGWLLNTHCHLDHVFGNRFMKEKFNLLTHAHSLEQAVLESGPDHARLFGLDMDAPPPIGHVLSDGQEITIGRLKVKVLHVPGHTPGHVTFYLEEEKTLFTGDVLFSGSIGRTDLPGGNHEQLMQGIRHTLLPLPAETTVYPGHGPATTLGHEKEHNPYLQ